VYTSKCSSFFVPATVHGNALRYTYSLPVLIHFVHRLAMAQTTSSTRSSTGGEAPTKAAGLARVLTNGEMVFADKFEPKNILLTGGAGFIGSHVAILLAKKYPAYKVRAFNLFCAASGLQGINGTSRQHIASIDELPLQSTLEEICLFNFYLILEKTSLRAERLEQLCRRVNACSCRSLSSSIV
jgi:hypothetical protein